MNASPIEVVNVHLDGDRLAIYQREGETVRRTTTTADWVTYARAAAVDAELRRSLSASNHVRSVTTEGEWLRIGWKDADIRRDMVYGARGRGPSPFQAKGIELFEGDVDPVRRWLSDNNAIIQRPRRMFFDLETDSRVPFSRKEHMRILSWAITDDSGYEKSAVLAEESDRAEHDLVAAFWEEAARYDQLLAWGLDNFDAPVLMARTDQCGVRVDPRRWLMLCQLTMHKRMNAHVAGSGAEKRSMALQNITMATLGEGKNDFDSSKTYEAWAAGGESREQLRRYNEQDTALLRKLEKKTGFADLFSTLAEVCRIFPDSHGLHPTRQMDGYMFRLGRERGVRFATRKRYQESEEGEEAYDGAFVMQPKGEGILRDVHVCDFTSLYPTVILTWNMSPETKVLGPANGPIPEGMCRSPLTGQCFSTSAVGILPIAVLEMIELRREWNEKKKNCVPGTPEWYDADRRQMAFKVGINSFYGVMGSLFSRYYDRDVAESVTQCGVWLIKRTIEEIEKRRMRTVYGDTDSVFVTDTTQIAFAEFVKWCNKDLYPAMVASVGCVRNDIALDYEKAFDRIVFVSAKRYAGRYSHFKGKPATKDSKPEIKGLEFKRGDSALLASNLQERIIYQLMDGEERVDAYQKMLDAALAHVLQDPLPVEEVQFSQSLSKSIKEYDSTRKTKKDGTPGADVTHVSVAKILAERGRDVGEGTRIEYFIADGSVSPLVVKPAEDYEPGAADVYYLWESRVYPPTQRLLQAAFPHTDWKAGYESVRPRKPRTKGRAAPEGQLALGSVVELFPDKKQALGPKPDEPFVIEVQEDDASVLLDLVYAAVKKHPGRRPLVITFVTRTGVRAVLDSPMRVTGDVRMQEDLEHARAWTSAAIADWETRICEG